MHSNNKEIRTLSTVRYMQETSQGLTTDQWFVSFLLLVIIFIVFHASWSTLKITTPTFVTTVSVWGCIQMKQKTVQMSITHLLKILSLKSLIRWYTTAIKLCTLQMFAYGIFLLLKYIIEGLRNITIHNIYRNMNSNSYIIKHVPSLLTYLYAFQSVLYWPLLEKRGTNLGLECSLKFWVDYY